MSTLTRRAARERWEAGRAALAPLLDGAALDGPQALAGWQQVEDVLGTLVANSALSGQALVAAARTAGALSLDEAHTLLDGVAAAARVAARPDGALPDADRAPLAAAARLVEQLSGAASLAPPPITPALGVAAAAAGDAPPGVSLPPVWAPPAPPPPASREPPRFAPPRDAASWSPPPVAPDAPARIDLSEPGAGRVARRAGARWVALLLPIAVIGAGVYLVADRWLGGGAPSSSAALTACRAAFEAGDLSRATAPCEDAGRAAAAGARAEAVGLVYLARLRRRAGDLPGAIAAADRAQRLLVDNGVALRELGAAFLDVGNPGEARRAFVAAVENDAADRPAMAGLACALHRLGRVDEARRWRTRADDAAFDACLAGPAGP